MFRIQFRKSKSKNYKEVVKLAESFYDHKIVEDIHVIDISVKELFEKWDYFNLIFWRTDKWIGSSFGYNDFDLYSAYDKKRLFYSVQSAHSHFLNLSVAYLRQIAPVYFEESFDEKIYETVFNQVDVDRMLDLLIAEKHRLKYKNDFENE